MISVVIFVHVPLSMLNYQVVIRFLAIKFFFYDFDLNWFFLL
jgi:hypothetical protein